MSTKTDNTAPLSPELVARGFTSKGKRTTTYRGREVTQEKYTKNEASGAGRVARAALTIAGAPLLVSKEFREMSLIPAWKGAVKKYAYEETGNAEQIDEKHLGYHPNKRTTIQEYVERPEIRAQLRESNGHYFLPEKRRADGKITSFIFIPNGDFSKARSIKVYEAGSGKAIKNTEKLLRAIRSYCAAYSDIKEGYKKQKEELANDLVNVYKRDKHMNLPIDQARAKIKQRPKTFVLDMRLGQARMYSDHDLSKRIDHDSFRTGTLIKLKDDTIKEIAKHHGKESKEPLEGNRPFKKAPPTTPDQEPLPGCADCSDDEGPIIKEVPKPHVNQNTGQKETPTATDLSDSDTDTDTKVESLI